jgi:hypothetical protein
VRIKTNNQIPLNFYVFSWIFEYWLESILISTICDNKCDSFWPRTIFFIDCIKTSIKYANIFICILFWKNFKSQSVFISWKWDGKIVDEFLKKIYEIYIRNLQKIPHKIHQRFFKNLNLCFTWISL